MSISIEARLRSSAIPIFLLTASAFAATTQPATRSTPRSADLIVVNHAGQVVKGAAVVVVPVPPKITRYYLFDGNLNPWIASGYRQSRTDAAGHCTVGLPELPAWIVAFHEDGYAHVRPQDLHDGVIHLEPWARITGHAIHAGTPAAGWSVMVQRRGLAGMIQFDPVLYNLTAQTDRDGRFAFDHVPPGPTRVVLLAQQDGTRGDPATSTTWLSPQSVDLKPSETRDVQLGGIGRPIEGSIIFPDGVDPAHFTRQGMIEHRDDAPPIPYPPDVYNGTSDQRKAWFDQWKKTPAYTTWDQGWRTSLENGLSYPVRWTGPTSFRIDEALPGNYTLNLTLTPAGKGEPTLRATETRFTAADAPNGGWTDRAMVLPPIALRYQGTRATIRQPAMDFTVNNLDGKPVKLSDYRGKVVLLDFWATWCSPCIAEIPNLRATYDAFARTGRFAILSVSYDETSAKAKAYVDAQKLPWDQTWIGNTAPGEIGEAYPGGLPTFVLIASDGKVFATDLRGEAIQPAVAAALKSMNP